ncbi:MAG: transcription antitermination factor NusB [Bacillota bacterium]
MAGTRHAAREAILKALFQVDVGKIEPGQAIAGSMEMDALGAEQGEFVTRTFLGVLENQSAIDMLIASLSNRWSLDRMPAVDRNVLRLGIYEIRYSDEVPVAVAINEAVELAKAYGTADSGRFVNGILGRVARMDEPSGDSGQPAEKT